MQSKWLTGHCLWAKCISMNKGLLRNMALHDTIWIDRQAIKNKPHDACIYPSIDQNSSFTRIQQNTQGLFQPMDLCMRLINHCRHAACNVMSWGYTASFTFYPGLRKTRSLRRNDRYTLWSYQASVMMMQVPQVISSNLCPKYAWPCKWTKNQRSTWCLTWFDLIVHCKMLFYDF